MRAEKFLTGVFMVCVGASIMSAILAMGAWGTYLDIGSILYNEGVGISILLWVLIGSVMWITIFGVGFAVVATWRAFHPTVHKWLWR